ncbi:grasp-with-spasm system SPASM domain peptide maturase [uncultured Dysgonomonas sp.]|uniref:grasp-with-spasm system SPASM domain peptide maturase n=1 Tax=uncultured Dysgonomonas sp. TaxID=206096 RepID=UPI000B0C877A|nr:grasp-with-spasm system SPASM domain peptide maturase [uncultured Dysgonomonas sp.]
MSNYRELFFHIFKNCKITVGSQNALLQNVSRSSMYSIDSELVPLLKSTEYNSLMAIQNEFADNDMDDIVVFFEWMQEIGFGKFCDEKEWSFWNTQSIEMYKEWDTPFYFNNAIIDYNESLKDQYFSFIYKLGLKGTSMLQIRFFLDLKIESIEEVLNYIASLNTFYGLSLVLDVNSFGNDINLIQERIIDKYAILNEVIIYNASKELHTYSENTKTNLICTSKAIDAKSCGAVQEFYFNLGIEHYTESLEYNTCLNRKIAVDSQGNIKNCPSMMESFGIITDTTLAEVINHPNFKKLWSINKDEISKCRDCEFRRVCTDCRAYLDNPEDIFSAPLKCGYDPYSAQWEEWSTNPIKQKAIEYYQL